MKHIWNSVRATVAIIVVVALCLFIGAFTYLGKIEGAKGLQVLETIGVIVITFYFYRSRNGDHSDATPSKPDKPVSTLPPPVRKA